MDLDQLEAFALANDRDAVVAGLIPGSQEYYYYSCLLAQHRSELDAVDEMLSTWRKRHGQTAESNIIEARQLVLRVGNEPASVSDRLRVRLGYNFDHQREVELERGAHPSSLPAEALKIESLMTQARLHHSGDSSGFTQRGLYLLLDSGDLDDATRRHMLSRITVPDHPKLVDHIVADLKARNSSFGSLPIHHRLLPTQLAMVGQRVPPVRTSAVFVETRLRALWPSADERWESDADKTIAYLDRLWREVSGLGTAFNSLKAHVLYHRLDAGRATGRLSFELFHAYLRLPRDVPYLARAFRRSNRDHIASLSTDFRQTTGFPAIGSDEELVRDYLRELLKDADDMMEFVDVIDSSSLRRWFATIKLLAGGGDLERWHQFFDDDGAFAELRDRVDIELVRENRTHYNVEDPIAVSARIKNVKTLVVNVFEINTVGYALKHGKLPDTAIDLDGLVASDRQTLAYDEPSYRSVLRTFELPQLKGPGVFVVELLGGGISSRALIRKGGLVAIERIGAGGHVFVVNDEQNRRVGDAVMHIGGAAFEADEHGEIRVPFTTRPRSQTAILTGDGRVEVITFHHQSERYTLNAGFFVARESLIAGANATVIAAPTLRVAGAEVPATLIEEAVLTIETTDRRGISARREIRDLALGSGDNLTAEFRVPDNLASCTFRLSGSVRSVSEQKQVELAAQSLVAVNGIDNDQHTGALHFAADGNHTVLHALGKNGEPRADLAIALQLSHRSFTDQVLYTLQTDERGRIDLGPLSEVGGVGARAPSGVVATLNLEEPQATLPPSVHGCAGESMVVPLRADRVVLLEKRGPSVIKDHSDKTTLVDGVLRVASLPPGDFELCLPLTGQSIGVHITESNGAGGILLGGRRLLEPSPTRVPRIEKLAVANDRVRIVVGDAGAATRVHVVGSRFVGSRSLWSGIGSGVVSRRRKQFPRPLPLSFYVSGRELGDEYRYVLERRLLKPAPGALTTRPSLLLNPWARQATDTEVIGARGGAAYASVGAPPPAPSAPEGAAFLPGAQEHKLGEYANINFLAKAAAVQHNLKVPADGVIELDIAPFASCSSIGVLLLDDEMAAALELKLPEPPLETRDLRLDEALPADQHASQLRRVSELLVDETLTVSDIASATLDIVDTMPRVHGLLCSLSSNPTLTEFGFISRWNALPDEERSRLYSKYACHELNLFLHFKDPGFFSRVVARTLVDKHHKTFLDHYFIDADLTRYLESYRYSRLNTLERILLASRLASESGNTLARIRDHVELVPRDLAREQRLFDAVVGGGALEADKLGFGQAQTRARGAKKKSRRREMAPPVPKSMAMAMEPDFDESDDASLIEDRFEAEESAADAEFDEKKRDMLSRSDARLYRSPDTTQELAETNYWRRRPSEQGPELIAPNRFWMAYAARDESRPFLSRYFSEATTTFTEMMAALAVLDLPFVSSDHETDYQGLSMSLRSKSAALVFHKQIAPADPAPDNVPVLVSQSYFRADDRYVWEAGEQLDNYVTGELLTHTVYQCQVILTNPTSSPKKLQVLLQTPQGSLPVAGGTQTRGQPIELAPYGTQSLEYSFYFPAPGSFEHYGAQVTLNEELIASVPSRALEVVATLSEIDTSSWAHVSQHGTTDEVLAHLETANLARTDLTKIAWRMRDPAVFSQTLDALERHRVFDPTLWSYALHHNDPMRITELLRHRDDLLSQLGPDLGVGGLKIDPIERGWFEHLEYAPLINARAHRLGAKRKIANKALETQFRRTLDRFSHLKELGDDEWLEIATGLFLQDRNQDAIAALARVSEAATGVQLDYMRAFAHIAIGNVEGAAALAARHQAHPIDRWRKKFEAMSAALAAVLGAAPVVIDEDDVDQAHTALAAGAPVIELESAGGEVALSHRNITSAIINYYLIDTELLFSRQPFVRDATDRFSLVKPNVTEPLVLSDATGRSPIAIPAALTKQNVVVEVVAGNIRESVVHYAHGLSVQLVERFGQLRVGASDSGKPIAGTYVKVYARKSHGEVVFYKDGYTDLTGGFDYASLSTNELDAVERFALLLFDPKRGSVVREAPPPAR